MRILLRGLLAVAGLLLLAMAGLGLFVSFADDEVYRSLARRLVAGVLERRVEVAGSFDFEPGLAPTLTLTDVRIANTDWAAAADLLELKRLEVQVDLPALLDGVVLVRHLALDGLRIALESGPDGRSNWHIFAPDGGGGGAFYPLMEAVTLSDVTLTYRDARSGWTGVLELGLLSERSGEDGSIETKGSGKLNGRPFELSGRAGSVEAALAARAPYPIELALELPALSLRLAGTADNLPRGEGFDLALTASSHSIERLSAVLGLPAVFDGRAALSARLSGALGRLAVPSLELEVSGPNEETLRVAGRVAELDDGAGLDLEVSGKFGPKAPVFGRLPAPLRDLRSLAYAARLSGGREDLRLDAVTIEAAHAEGGALHLDGGLALDLTAGDPRLTDLAATASLSLPGPRLLARLLGVKLPALGPIAGKAKLSLAQGRLSLDEGQAGAAAYGALAVTASGALGRLSGDGPAIVWDPALALTVAMQDSAPLIRWIDRDMAARVPDLGPFTASGRLLAGARLADLRAALGRKDKLWAEAEGEVAELLFAAGRELDGLSLAMTVGWDASASLGALLGETLPDLGPGGGRFEARGALEALAVSKAQFTTTRADGLTARAEGAVARLALLPELRFAGVAFDLAASAPTTAVASGLAGYDFPELGPVQSRARLAGGDARYGLAEIFLAAGPPAAPALRLTGKIQDLDTLSGIALSGSFDVATERALAQAGLTGAPPLGALQGRFELSDADGSLGLEGLEAEVVGTRLLALKMTGLFDDIAAADQLSFATDLSVPVPKDLAAALGWGGIDLAAFAFHGEVSGSDEDIKAEGKAKIGETELSGTLGGSFSGERPHLKARLGSPRLRFADFGLAPDADETATAGAGKAKAAAPLFGTAPLPFELLRRFDLDLDVLIDELEGVSLEVDRAELKARLEGGRLEIAPLAFNLVRGRLRLDARIDARGQLPGLAAKVSVDDLDLGDFLGQLEAEVPLDGNLDMILDLRAAGLSPRALADSLSGAASLAVERGHINSALFAYTALDLGNWLFAKSTRKGYSQLNCFVARFAVKDGLAESQMLLLDTPNVRALGEGAIDLRRERLHIEVDPQPKSKPIANLTTPFTIKGPLRNPHLKVSTTGAAARTLGELVLTPVNLLGNLLPFVGGDDGKEDNPCLDFEK